MVRAVGYHRRRDSKIWVWRGNPHKLSTMTHELLHRITNKVPQAKRLELEQLTGDPKINEGLTSYFTDYALRKSGRPVDYANPPAGASFSQLRSWSRGIRSEVRGVFRDAFNLKLEPTGVFVASDRIFGRCFARDFGRPWEAHPGQPGSYGNSKARVAELVRLGGLKPVAQAYFFGNTGELLTNLRRARQQGTSSLPDWLNL